MGDEELTIEPIDLLDTLSEDKLKELEDANPDNFVIATPSIE